MPPFLIPPEHAPRLFREVQVVPEEARSILRHQKDDRYGWGYSLNPYRGCSYGCKYCYVRGYPAPIPNTGSATERPRLREASDWGGWVTPKLNAPELLWAQRHRLHNESVFISSATDPYQPIEKDFRLTRKCLQVLLACPTTRVIIHTRSPMILQDLELLRAFGSRLSIGFSIPTDDDYVRQILEPEAPPIPARWAAVERLARAGLRVGISAAPLLAVHDMTTFANKVRDSGARSAWAGGLRLLKDDPFYGVLSEHQWLRILDPDHVREMRQALKEALGDRSPGHHRRQLVPEPVWANSSATRRPIQGPSSHRVSAHRQFKPGSSGCHPSRSGLPVHRPSSQDAYQPGLFEEAS